MSAVVAVGILISSATAASGTAPSARSPYRAVAITTPGSADRVTSKTPRFAGTGEPGANVVVRDTDDTVLCATRVGSGGWSCESIVEMGDGRTTAIATQTAWGYESRATVGFTVAFVPEPFFVRWIPTAIGVGIAAMLLLGLVVLMIRRARRRRAAVVTDDRGVPAASEPQPSPRRAARAVGDGRQGADAVGADAAG